MKPPTANTDWNSFARANASQKWRKQSAAMGSDLTAAIVAAARVQPGMHVLDIACGTGEPSISLAALVGIGTVTGVDISPAPLRIAEERAAQRGLTNTKFQQADAHQLPFADDTFDRITSRLGVMFFSDLPRAFSEMRRVLKPAGTATLVSWGPMEQPYFATTSGTVMRALSADLPEPARKMFAFGKPGVLEQAMRQAGFARVSEQLVTLPWTWPGSPVELWEYFQDVAVPFAPLLKSVPDGERAQMDKAVIKEITSYFDGEKINFTATVNLTVAVK